MVSFETQSTTFDDTLMTLDTDVISFTVRAKQDAMIRLNKHGDIDDYILITLGKSGTDQSTIERNGQTPLEFATPDILSENEERPFWIAMYNNSIEFGEEEYHVDDSTTIGSIPATDVEEFAIMSFSTGDTLGRWNLRKYTGEHYWQVKPLH